MPLLFKGAPAVTYAVWFFFAAPFGSVMFVAGASARRSTSARPPARPLAC